MNPNVRHLIFIPNFTTVKKPDMIITKRRDRHLGDSLEYFEVYEAVKPMFILLRCLGILPLVKDEVTGKLIKFKFRSWITLYTLVPLSALLLSCYLAIETYGKNLKNEVERVTTITYFVSSIGCSVIMILTSSFKARNAKDIFLAWQQVDAFLQFDYDYKLRRFGRMLTIIFISVIAIGLVMAISITVLIMTRKEVSVSSNNMVLLGLFIWVTYNVSACMMTDFIFLYFAKAIEIRLQHIEIDLRSVLRHRRYDISVELEKCRIAFHLLLEMVTKTSKLLSPVLLLTCITGGVQVLFAVYGVMIPQESVNVAWNVLKSIFGALSIVKFAIVCSFGSSVTSTAIRVITILKKTSAVGVSPSTKFELQLFMIKTMTIKTDFTASGYFSINLGFLSTIISVIVTYCITIVQFNGLQPKPKIDFTSPAPTDYLMY